MQVTVLYDCFNLNVNLTSTNIPSFLDYVKVPILLKLNQGTETVNLILPVWYPMCCHFFYKTVLFEIPSIIKIKFFILLILK